MALIVADFLFEPWQDHHIVLSHTCRALRNVVLNVPTVWSHLCSSMSEKELHTYISRSKKALLTIRVLSPGDNNKRWWNFWLVVKPLTHRWISLEFNPENHCTGRRFYMRLRRELAQLELPKLTQFRIAISTVYRWPQTTKDIKIDLPHFYSSWSPPNLTSLSAWDVLPTLYSMGETVTDLQVMLQARARRWIARDL
jgi:hypothetical protein